EEILPEGALLERLEQCAREQRPLRVKQGFDPTAPDIHLGHTVGLRKLRQFQMLGHQIVLIVGDYTALVGDPSGRSATRPQLAAEEVEANAKTYLDQFFRVLERNPLPPQRPVEIHRNGDWFSKMTFLDVIQITSRYTVSQMLERDDFSKRFASETPIGLHEFLYPIMQGYDSVVVRADVELGATEQKFNLLVGREMQKLHHQLPQIVLMLSVLPGTDGVRRMSKSLGNYIGVADPPEEMFGKLMSIPDQVMPTYWRLLTENGEGEGAGEEGTNPMANKKRLARHLVGLYHGDEEAGQAQRDFEAQFQRGEAPASIAVWNPDPCSEMGIKDLLVKSGLARSGSDAWRHVSQGAVSINGVKVTDRDHRQNMASAFVLRLGRKMVRVEPKSD
ncbi:MAG: tyrosine--tRNA ligase, partial [Acidimicrobiia bacterium]